MRQSLSDIVILLDQLFTYQAVEDDRDGIDFVMNHIKRGDILSEVCSGLVVIAIFFFSC
jgi:hypothetical protein